MNFGLFWRLIGGKNQLTQYQKPSGKKGIVSNHNLDKVRERERERRVDKNRIKFE